MRSYARSIARNDLRQLRQSRDFWLPLAIVALFMFVVVPAVLLLTLISIEDPTLTRKLSDLAGDLPDAVRQRLLAADPRIEAPYAIAIYLLPPLVTLVPLTVASAVAANTFVGERERGSGEFLAHSPAPIRAIFHGKLLATIVPAGLTALGGLVAYALVVNLVLGMGVDDVWFPTGNWWIIFFWVEPPLLVVASAAILVVSSRVGSGAAAQQAASLISLPLVACIYAVAATTQFERSGVAWAVGVAAWVLAAVVIWAGGSTLRRDRLLGVGS